MMTFSGIYVDAGYFPECQSCTLDKHCGLTHNQVLGAMEAIFFCHGSILLDEKTGKLRCRACGAFLDNAYHCRRALLDNSNKFLSAPKSDYKSIIRPQIPTVLRLTKEVVDNMGK